MQKSHSRLHHANAFQLYEILQYRDMEASKYLAYKAQRSANSMEIMIRKMQDIAQKTAQETLSMRIITLVTLFFLPGTFVSVSTPDQELLLYMNADHCRL